MKVDRKLFKRPSRYGWILAALLTLGFSTAHAEDGGLYGPSAPPGSAFIRVFNATDQADLEAKVGNEVLSDIPAWTASEFVFVPAGIHRLVAGTRDQSVTLLADRYYTAVAGSGPVQLLDNDNYGNRLKALLILYNLTGDSGLSLRTQDGKTVVIPDVSSNAFGKREVNPSRVQLALFKGDKRVADAPPVSLARGQAFSLFVIGQPAAPRLVWAVN